MTDAERIMVRAIKRNAEEALDRLIREFRLSADPYLDAIIKANRILDRSNDLEDDKDRLVELALSAPTPKKRRS